MNELSDTILQDITRAGFDPASWAKDVHVDRAALAEGERGRGRARVASRLAARSCFFSAPHSESSLSFSLR